ncbi:family 78 glycoside hydrolase catalytic domain [Azospirillum sp. B4]|uniref:alpha-L-rhamnosidase-related protein n=1 Tax=Azospirillum sp. B4 TaxID=95605 RepID=UPI0006796B76|nr:family 78 glycoside hydrolase catalytic domain [Azospirillum sp. B4]
MNRREMLLVVGGAAVAAAAVSTGTSKPAQAQDMVMEPAVAGAPNAEWGAKADALMPALVETAQPPLALVRAVADTSSPLRWRMETEAPADSLAGRAFKKGDSFILDFGGHRTGHLAFRLETVGREPDAPARLRLTFGEVPSDVAEPLYPYQGVLSSAWLPDEVINVDYLPQSVHMPRRYAFRYVKVEVVDTSSGFSVRFEDVKAIALTSAKATPAPLPAKYSDLARRIDAVSLATLRDCMQTTFEDGPRRDQRLWVGDLRLQALANYATFKQNDLVKRCLYLFAAYRRQDGLVAACVYEKPKARYGGIHIVDYAALFNVALADYLEATGDEATARELWPVAKRQLEIIGQRINADGRYVDPGNVWIFIDWSRDLHKDAAIQGLLVFAHKRTLDLARKLGLEREVADYPVLIDRMTKAARAFWDAGAKAFVSGPGHQVSWASQAWMAIGGVLPARDCATALKTALASPTAVKPVTPYLYHYMAEALLDSGLDKEAKGLVESYWGGMVKAGADTFWEVYDPAQPLSSPYGDIHINSYCHAWSCTPTYFYRARGMVA